MSQQFGSYRPERSPPPTEDDLARRIGRVVGEIEALKQERQHHEVQSARLKIGTMYARARLEKRVRNPSGSSAS